MAFELMAYFHGGARTLTCTPHTYGRGFADAHRRFSQAFLALPVIPGSVVKQGDVDLKVRESSSPNGIYIGVVNKGFAGKKLTFKHTKAKPGARVKNLVTNEIVLSAAAGDGLEFAVDSGPTELNSFLVR